MKAVRVAEFGGPKVLKVDENVPIPVPSESQVLIEVRTAGINPVDTYIRAGTHIRLPKTFPFIPGLDGAGIVKQVGAQVTQFKAGDRVYFVFTAAGAYAQFTVEEEAMVCHLDDSLTYEQGAAIGIPYYTAIRSLSIKVKHKMKAGNTVLVHGASGAVGLACVQLAVSMGTSVYGTAGSQEGLDLVLKHGATAVFNHREPGYIDNIMEAMGGRGPDVIVEMLANVNLESDLKIINMTGMIVIVGSRGTIEIAPAQTLRTECSLHGVQLPYSTEAEWKEMHSVVKDGVKQGWLKPHVYRTFKLEEAPLAHHHIINTKSAQGKIVFTL